MYKGNEIPRDVARSYFEYCKGKGPGSASCPVAVDASSDSDASADASVERRAVD